jgi:hypothetical protein
MDMPALYSLVKTDDQGHKALLEEQANSMKAGYSSAKQAGNSLSFQCKIPEIFGPGKSNKTNHQFVEVATHEKWLFTGSKQVFRASVEDDIRQVEPSTTTYI